MNNAAIARKLPLIVTAVCVRGRERMPGGTCSRVIMRWWSPVLEYGDMGRVPMAGGACHGMNGYSTPARMYSRLSRAMCSTEICFGHSASHA